MSEPQIPLEPPRRRAALAFIFVTVLIDILSFGIIIPVLPHLIIELVGGSIAKAAVWSSAFGTLFMLMQFVFSPIQGALSDRFGRRTVILISSFGLGIDFIVMALAPVLWLLFLGRAVSGVCAASFSTANAYIADITPHEKRAASFGLLGAAFGIGFIIGPALGGLLGGLPDTQVAALRTYGMELGYAFQIADDLLDYVSDAGTLGKNIGDDLAEGKPTLPLIYALQRADDDQRRSLRHAIERGGLDSLDRIIASIRESGALERTRERAEHHARAARAALDILPASAHRDALLALAEKGVAELVAAQRAALAVG